MSVNIESLHTTMQRMSYNTSLVDHAMSNIENKGIVYERRYSDEEFQPSKLIAVSPGGTPKLKLEPPRQRALVIGLKKDGKITIVFPDGTTGANGHHAECEPFAINASGGKDQLEAVLWGSIAPIPSSVRLVDGTREPSQHQVTIHSQNHRDQEATEFHEQWEQGKINPSQFLNEERAQQLLRSLGAHTLIVEPAPTGDIMYRHNPVSIRKLGMKSRQNLYKGD